MKGRRRDRSVRQLRSDIVAEETSKRWAIRLKIASVLFISSVILGYTAGVAMSPKYDTPTEVEAYVLAHLDDGDDALSDGGWSVELLPGTKLISSLKPLSGNLIFSCHCKSFGYSLKSDKMLGPWNNESDGCLVELTEVQRHGLNFKDTLGVLIGSLEGYTIKLAITESRNYWLSAAETSVTSRVRTIIIAAASVISGSALGFYWGYKEKPNCETNAFQKQLASADLWAVVGHQWVRQHSWRFTYDKPTVANDILRAWERSYEEDKKTQPITVTQIANGRRSFTLYDLRKDFQISQDYEARYTELEMEELFSPALRYRCRHNETLRSGSVIRLLFGP